MQKRYIARVLQIGKGMGLNIPAQFARELGIARGNYFEFRTPNGADIFLSRVSDPKPAPALENKNENE